MKIIIICMISLFAFNLHATSINKNIACLTRIQLQKNDNVDLQKIADTANSIGLVLIEESDLEVLDENQIDHFIIELNDLDAGVGFGLTSYVARTVAHKKFSTNEDLSRAFLGLDSKFNPFVSREDFVLDYLEDYIQSCENFHALAQAAYESHGFQMPYYKDHQKENLSNSKNVFKEAWIGN